MKYLIKGLANDNENADYGRVILDNSNVYLKGFVNNNGYDYVNLGLPSGLLWAKYNIGATAESEVGLYFQWGDTQGYTADQVGTASDKKEFDSVFTDYKYSDQTTASNYTKPNFTKYCDDSTRGYNGFTDNLTTLDLSDDAAHINMGGSWRMPTIAEFTELLKKTTVKLVDSNDKEIDHGDWHADDGVCHSSWNSNPTSIKGIKCYNTEDTSKYIFLPACGNCISGSVYDVGNGGSFWSSSLYSDDCRFGRDLYFGSGGVRSDGSNTRCYGLPVRGVLVQ